MLEDAIFPTVEIPISMTSVPTDLAEIPDYAGPPVIETVLGVQFDRVPMRNAHLGVFWKALDHPENWPAVVDAPPLPLQRERFDAPTEWERAIQFRLTQDLAGRLQIKNATGDRMIQVQNNRLHFNWLGKSGDPYPRYESVRSEFRDVLRQFVEFLSAEKLGSMHPNQWEVTYVNQIPRGSVWSSPSDWGFFLPLQGLPIIETVVEGESFGGEWHFIIPGNRGRLHVEWQHGKREPANENAQDFIRLTLTARGSLIEAGETEDRILEGVDLGRSTIVRSFRHLMSEDANRFWGLTS